MSNPEHTRLLKPAKLKLNDEERLIANGFTTTCTAKFTAEDVNEGMGVDTALLYEQVQGKLRRSVSPRILIVMRSRIKAGAFAYVLMRHGCEVVVATNGHKAYTSYLRKSSADFSLCLCQWYLPGLAGRDLAYYEAESGGRLPFVALLGSGQRATDAIRSGADLFLKLPLLPHLRWVLNLVHPHTSTMAQIRVGAMMSNFEGMRRLLTSQQDVMRHTIETNILSELVKEDLAQLSEISTMDVGVNMLDAVMATVRAQEAAAAATASAPTDRLLLEEAQPSLTKKGSNVSTSAANRKKSLKSRVQQMQDEAAAEQLKSTLAARDVQFRAVATSFRNVMMVLNKVRVSLAATQADNHLLREHKNRSSEHIDLLKGQLRSLGVDVVDAKLERLYLPRRLTRSPPPPDPAVEPFHHGVANDPEIDVTQYSKQDLMRALRAAKAAIASANEEIVELTDDLQRMQEYQIEVEDELVGSAGLAVHFHIGGAGGPIDNPLFQPQQQDGRGCDVPSRSSDEFESSTTSSMATTSFAGGGACTSAGVRVREGSTVHSVSEAMTRKRSNRQINEERLVRSLSMMGPRLQDEFMRQQSISMAATEHHTTDGNTDRPPVAATGQHQPPPPSTAADASGSGGAATTAMRRTRSMVHLITATSTNSGGSKGHSAGASPSPLPAAAGSKPPTRGGAADHVDNSSERQVERQRKKKTDDAKLFFARRLFWTAHVNKHLEQRIMESEDARGAFTAKFKAVPAVPRCAEKPMPDASNALDALVNGIVELHNTVATEVNTCTAKLAATFPGCSATLRHLSTEVKNGLVAFNAGQHIIGLNLYVEGKIVKLLSEERDAWTKERMEMERYKFLNPPGSRKAIADLRTSVRELRMNRWKDWFQGVDVKLRANYLRKWIVWLLHRLGDKKWKANVKRLENDINASTSKKTAEQIAFARRQSTDVLAKQSQTRIDFEQLQVKYQRVAQLYDEAKSKLAALTKEHESAVEELEDVKNKKVLLDEANCEKITEILRLTQAVAPLEEELLAVRGVLGEREQKLMTLQAQLFAYQRKVQQLTNGGRTTMSGSFGGTTFHKAVQTALSAKTVGAELDAILMNRRGSGLHDFSASGRLSGSFAMTTDIDFDAEGGAVRVTSPTLSGGAASEEDHHCSDGEAAKRVTSADGDHTPLFSEASPEKQVGGGRARKGLTQRSNSVSDANLLQKPLAGSGTSLSLRTPRQDSLLTASGDRTPALSDLLTPHEGGLGKETKGKRRRNKGHRNSGATTSEGNLSHQSSPFTAVLSPQSTASMTPPIAPFPALVQTGPPEEPLDAPPGIPTVEGSPRRLSTTLVGSGPKKASSLRKPPSKLGDGAVAGRKASTGDGAVPRRRAVSLNASLLSTEGIDGGQHHANIGHPHASPSTDGASANGHSDTDLLAAWGTAAGSSASAETTTSFASPFHTSSFQRASLPTMVDRASSALALTASTLPVMVHRDVQTALSCGTERVSSGSCPETETDALLFPEHVAVAPPSHHHGCGGVAPLDGSLAASDEYDLANVSGDSSPPFALLASPPQAAVATSPRGDGRDEREAALGASLRRSTSLSVSDQLSPKSATNGTTKPFALSDTSKWHSALKELKHRGSGFLGPATGTGGGNDGAKHPAAVSKMGHMIDSARRLFDTMGIPQNVLVKTTDEMEMMDALRHVLDAAAMVVAQQQRSQSQKEPAGAALSSSFRFSNQQQPAAVANSSFVLPSQKTSSVALAAADTSSSTPSQLVSPLHSPRSAVAPPAAIPNGASVEAPQGMEGRSSTPVDSAGRSDAMALPPILSPRTKGGIRSPAVVGSSPASPTRPPPSNQDVHARLPAVTQGRRTQHTTTVGGPRKTSLCIDTRRPMARSGDASMAPSLPSPTAVGAKLSPVVSPTHGTARSAGLVGQQTTSPGAQSQQQPQRPAVVTASHGSGSSAHADPLVALEETSPLPHPPREEFVDAQPPIEPILGRKDAERERASARTNVAVLLQKEMLRRPGPRAPTDTQPPPPSPPQRPYQEPSKRPLGGPFVRSLR